MSGAISMLLDTWSVKFMKSKEQEYLKRIRFHHKMQFYSSLSPHATG